MGIKSNSKLISTNMISAIYFPADLDLHIVVIVALLDCKIIIYSLRALLFFSFTFFSFPSVHLG